MPASPVQPLTRSSSSTLQQSVHTSERLVVAQCCVVIRLCASADVHAGDQPLVITSSPDSVVRTRQSLYEAVLRLEQQQVVVIERRLGDCDIILNASTCVCVWTEAQLLQVKDQNSEQ